MAITAPRPVEHDCEPSGSSTSIKEKDAGEGDVSSLQETSSEQRSLMRNGRVSRLSTPFIASHDIPRGAIFALQALLAYLLMLAVMCVNLVQRGVTAN